MFGDGEAKINLVGSQGPPDLVWAGDMTRSEVRRSMRVLTEQQETFAFPPKLGQGLEAATDEQLSQVEILGAGSGLHWENLDADLSVPGLLAGLFGTRAYLARQAGLTRSQAKAAAARGYAIGWMLDSRLRDGA